MSGAEITSVEAPFALNVPLATDMQLKYHMTDNQLLQEQALVVEEHVNQLSRSNHDVTFTVNHPLFPEIRKALVDKGYSVSSRSNFSSVNGNVTENTSVTVSLLPFPMVTEAYQGGFLSPWHSWFRPSWFRPRLTSRYGFPFMSFNDSSW